MHNLWQSVPEKEIFPDFSGIRIRNSEEAREVLYFISRRGKQTSKPTKPQWRSYQKESKPSKKDTCYLMGGIDTQYERRVALSPGGKLFSSHFSANVLVGIKDRCRVSNQPGIP